MVDRRYDPVSGTVNVAVAILLLYRSQALGKVSGIGKLGRNGDVAATIQVAPATLE
jgi:hypothetical protein